MFKLVINQFNHSVKIDQSVDPIIIAINVLYKNYLPVPKIQQFFVVKEMYLFKILLLIVKRI